ncbi:hypothetical protein C2E23DRAFT_862783 [Lenzites betulinus]|nr:hypothetical protein C2E23DRAFT_862783 [Lenzites betulinus]
MLLLAMPFFLGGWALSKRAEAALSKVDECANDHLQEIVAWLEGWLPADLFEGPHILPVNQEPFKNPLIVQLPPRGPVLPLQWGSPPLSMVFDSGFSAVQDNDMLPLFDNDDNSSGSMCKATWESVWGH